MKRSALVALCGFAYLTACADNPVAPPSGRVALDVISDQQHEKGVAAVGIMVEQTGSTLVLEQRGMQFEAAPGAEVGSVEYTPSIGTVGGKLQVLVDDSTQLYFDGNRVSSLAEIPLGAQLLVGGRAEGGALRAKIVTDLTGMTPPTEAQKGIGEQRPEKLPAPPMTEAMAAAAVHCPGQVMDYGSDPSVWEFHGCWGGPSASDSHNLDPNIPFSCSLIPPGCFMVDRYSYTLALGGWTYDWPFRIAATSSGLTYHVPGTVNVKVTSLPASGRGFTFTGGLGVDFGLNVDWCWITGDCDDLGTVHVGVPLVIHQTRGAAPLRGGERLDLAAVACPGIGYLTIPGLGSAIEVSLCEDLGINGSPFFAVVGADGARGYGDQLLWFDGDEETVEVTPDSATVMIHLTDFEWAPTMTKGLSFVLEIIGIELFRTPQIPLGGGSFQPITTPFPRPGSDFYLATDPMVPEDYLPQPELAGFRLPVAPAPTTLAIVAVPTLPEGSPLRANLTESYDGSAIAGVPVRFTVTNANGTQAMSGVTDGNGIAEILLPNGEHRVTADFDGSAVYVPSRSATQHVFVYRPTTFVIWGGNSGGVTLGGRYQFWGSQWAKQVTAGDFTANASFKGYAHTVNGTLWIGAGGNSVRPPNELAELIGVIVTTDINRQRNRTVGNIAEWVILRVEDLASYRADPGHEAFGLVAARLD